MQNFGEFNKASAVRPYWLLLALVLFLAGQVATAAHWHDDRAAFGDQSSLDLDCALCVLSSAAGAALTSDPLILASIALCTFIFTAITRTFIARRAPAYDSRAPPFHS